MKNYETLYLRTRPQLFQELDSSQARDSLIKIFTSGRVPHAFLLAGPKGIGKTSAARIIAKVVNCEAKRKNNIEPCNKCDQCKSITEGNNLDVIELDAASHRGIDDVRALRDAVKLSPTGSGKKIYIIDEAHMLTAEASNALLKTLEEPPDHVLFVLATTNPEKLIPTIRSRVTNIVFNKAKKEELVRSLERVTKGEKIKAESQTLELLAEASDGSFRDAVKTLEQFMAQGGKFKAEDVKKFIYGSVFTGAERLFDLLHKAKTKEALEEVEKVISGGLSTRSYLESLLKKTRDSLLAKAGIGQDELVEFSKDELIELTGLLLTASNETAFSLIEQLPLELAIIKWCEKRNNGSFKKPEEEEKKVVETKNTPPSKATRVNGKALDETIWKKILEMVRPRNTSTEALLRAAKPINFDGKNLTLGVFYSFHKEHLEGNFHKSLLEEVVESVLGAKVRISCMLTEPPPRKIIEKAQKEPVLTEGSDEDIVKVAEEIFGN